MEMGQFVAAVSNLIHALQLERGASNLFLGSEGSRFAAELRLLSGQADAQIDEFYQALTRVEQNISGMPGGTRMFNRIACVVHTLSDRVLLRKKVCEQKIDAVDATRVYSALIKGLLAVVFEAADAAVDPTISRVLVAMFHFMQGKELAGQERAAGAAGFAGGGFSHDHVARMSHLIEAQERCFEVFSNFADHASLAGWEQAGLSTQHAELERLRRMACTVGTVIANRSAADKEKSSTLADRWFTLMTARIDAMKSVEDMLEKHLQDLCVKQLNEARQRLEKHQELIETLLLQDESQTESFIVMRAGLEPGLNSDSVQMVADGGRPAAGRSVIELLQFQAQRLQSMSDELDAAKNALEERKLLERAKLLLMEHRKLSEAEAHRFLRQTAMNQSRRLTDVARSVIEMVEMFK